MNGRVDEILVFDGACGTNIQRMGLPPSAWGAHEGCNEFLNLSAPEAIESLHASFLEAGANVLETNTFGANAIVLAEYGLADRVEEINRAAVERARAAIRAAGRPARVAGSIGPTTKLPSLGHVAPGALAEALGRQARALVEAGADLLAVETCQDLLQVKIALVAAYEAMERAGRAVPVMVSLTVEPSGTLLVGTDVAAAAAAIEPFPVFSIGLNCATGPEGMTSHIRWLSRHWPGRISCLPNAGIPRVEGGRTVYPLGPEEFAAQLSAFVVREGVSVVGGCCGTTPEHIRRLAAALRGARPAPRDVRWKPSLSSLYQSVEVAQEIPPLLVGERANANGSRRFRDALLADDFDLAVRIGASQEEEGAHAVDLCAAYAGRNEMEDLSRLTGLFARSVRAPLVIDSTSPECVEAALAIYPGRPLVNSVNLEDGGKTLDRVGRAARKAGAAVVALAIDEKGMAMTAGEKVAVARRIHDRLVGRLGLRPRDLFFDMLTFTVGSGEENLRGAAAQTLEAVRRVKEELPGVFTLLGVSNVSFGLSPAARRVLNSVFLHEAIAAGLDAAIVDAARILPVARIPAEERRMAEDLLYDRPREDGRTPLSAFIAHFSGKTEEAEGEAAAERPWRSPEQALADKVQKGDKEGLEDLLAILVNRHPAGAVVGQILVPAMRRVGELFGRGEMLLPFVLQSAETMRWCVEWLRPHLGKAEGATGREVLLATVAGDVHDIGKNLVDIILSNNGYRVHNIGIRVAAETLVAQAKALGVDAIGLSGLLVRSALVMKEDLAQLAAAGIDVPVLLGGAALTQDFVALECAPRYEGPVVYCADAFAGLAAMRELDAGTLRSTPALKRTGGRTAAPGPKGPPVARDAAPPEPPFLGARHVRDIDPATLFPWINEQALFRGRWGFRRGKAGAEEYRRLVEETVRPLYEELKGKVLAEDLVFPRVAYGYFACASEGDALRVRNGDREELFAFPRQKEPPHLCIADYFRSQGEGGDVVAFFVATVGERIGAAARALYGEGRYRDYLLLHALGVELTDALAEAWHARIRRELGIAEREPATPQGLVAQEYRGSRYGFGYPACPDLSAHVPVFALLSPDAIGVTLTESMEMVPEQTTSAIVVHHPRAKYFAV